jgi:hypothetical protein
LPIEVQKIRIPHSAFRIPQSSFQSAALQLS